MTTFTKISDLSVITTLSDNDKFIVETSTGTKACTRSALREAVTITKADVGLGNCDNTADLDKPISTATQTALDAKLASTTAANTYLTQTDAASTYLTQNNASGTYLSKTDAATYYASSSHTHNTGNVTLLTGYSKGSTGTALAATDTLNAALSKLENQIDGKQASGSYAAASHTHIGTDVVLTGYTMASSASAIAATDTVSVALGKLEKTLDGVETLLAAV